MKRSPLRYRSNKRAKHMRTSRAPMVAEAVASGRYCEVCPILAAAHIPTLCGRHISGFHERRKSSAAGSRENPANLLAACSWGNGFIEDEPELVRERTGDALVVREGDPEWEALSARAWRLR